MNLLEFSKEWNESIGRNDALPRGPIDDDTLLYLNKCMIESMVIKTGNMYDIELDDTGLIDVKELDKLESLY